MPSLKIKMDLLQSLRCPVCYVALVEGNEYFLCSTSDCGKQYPIIDGVPVLINDSESIFSINDYVNKRPTTMGYSDSLSARIKSLFPSISHNFIAVNNYAVFFDKIKNTPSRRVLIIGGSIMGEGLKPFYSDDVEFIDSDVTFGKNTKIIFDAHNIPFADCTFDGVIIQAVLEHVADPFQCVGEIHRVLKTKGLVYSETPFMQQVHMGKYDFMRFTYLGHRRLFRKFDELSSGPLCGPGMALAWSLTYFLQSFTNSKTTTKIIGVVSQILFFWLKYFDYYLIKKNGAYDSASAYYFLGTKSRCSLTDRELIQLYKGNIS